MVLPGVLHPLLPQRIQGKGTARSKYMFLGVVAAVAFNPFTIAKTFVLIPSSFSSSMLVHFSGIQLLRD